MLSRLFDFTHHSNRLVPIKQLLNNRGYLHIVHCSKTGRLGVQIVWVCPVLLYNHSGSQQIVNGYLRQERGTACSNKEAPDTWVFHISNWKGQSMADLSKVLLSAYGKFVIALNSNELASLDKPVDIACLGQEAERKQHDRFGKPLNYRQSITTIFTL
ncbi:hypothetical protein X801_00176 [Opisthorchis viverrini]|uniref:Uncharacterized protein n=1 Tax=Opisthorchis viverrini TaxID=6198 RepID=A0A1S8XBV2_OPIVI|nr:hypothetical protein X801_00176 [Opisthorchis viverrini]